LAVMVALRRIISASWGVSSPTGNLVLFSFTIGFVCAAPPLASQPLSSLFVAILMIGSYWYFTVTY
jgi:hypothetical protein